MTNVESNRHLREITQSVNVMAGNLKEIIPNQIRHGESTESYECRRYARILAIKESYELLFESMNYYYRNQTSSNKDLFPMETAKAKVAHVDYRNDEVNHAAIFYLIDSFTRLIMLTM